MMIRYNHIQAPYHLRRFKFAIIRMWWRELWTSLRFNSRMCFVYVDNVLNSNFAHLVICYTT